MNRSTYAVVAALAVVFLGLLFLYTSNTASVKSTDEAEAAADRTAELQQIEESEGEGDVEVEDPGAATDIVVNNNSPASVPPKLDTAAPAAAAPFVMPAPLPPVSAPGSAQDREDRYAQANFFPKLRGGLVIESGALDGVTFSTSLIFQKELDWKAIHVEASPASFAKLAANRPANDKTININTALCKSEAQVHYIEASQHSPNPAAVGGIVEFMAPTFIDTYWPKHADGQRHSMHTGVVATVTAITCRRLDSILDEYKVPHVDFWVLDVEGAELEVAQTVDLKKYRIDVIVVELDGRNEAKDNAVKALLLANDYLIHSTFPVRNTWFVRKDFFPKHFVPA